MNTEPEWIIHAVQSDANPGYVNYHTHGLTELYGHTELSIYSDFPSDICSQILNELGEKIRDGLKLEYKDCVGVFLISDESGVP